MATFSKDIIDQVWKKAQTVPNYDPTLFRKDAAGAWISYNGYGDRNNAYGWEIEHVFPESKGGDDKIENLRAMQWENNVSKGDDYPVYRACVIAEGNRNIKKESQRTINSNLRETLSHLYSI